MNIVRALATLTIALNATAVYAEKAPMFGPELNIDRVTIDCRNEQRPTMNSIGALIQSNNAGYISHQRERLVGWAHRECLRGIAASITFVRDTAAAETPAFAMLETAH